MKLLGWAAVAALVVAGGLAGRAWTSGAGPEAAAPEGPQIPSVPQQTAPDSPSAERPIDAAAAGTVGLTVEYLDEDGQIKKLDVKDFPR